MSQKHKEMIEKADQLAKEITAHLVDVYEFILAVEGLQPID